MIDYETMKKNFEEEHSLKCPHCGEDYIHDSEFKDDLITYHGEDGVKEKECGQCEKKFYVKECVDRTWEIGKTEGNSKRNQMKGGEENVGFYNK